MGRHRTGDAQIAYLAALGDGTVADVEPSAKAGRRHALLDGCAATEQPSPSRRRPDVLRDRRAEYAVAPIDVPGAVPGVRHGRIAGEVREVEIQNVLPAVACDREAPVSGQRVGRV